MSSSPPPSMEPPSGSRRGTWVAIAAIAVLTLVALAALASAFPLYLQKDQTCIIPGTGSPGVILCGGKPLPGSLNVKSPCPGGSTCVPLSSTDTLEMLFNATKGQTLYVSYTANESLAMNLVCGCGPEFGSAQPSLDGAKYGLITGTYTIALTNHNQGPAIVTWTVYVDRLSIPGYGPLSIFPGPAF